VRFADGWCPGRLSPDEAKESIARTKQLAKENGRDPERFEFSVFLLGLDEGPDAAAIERYAEAGVHRLVVVPSDTARGSAAEAIKRLAHVVETAAKV
jgi:alkanesulfonate monooxygenase SsuD/methylene tetrahydromethanopterin reductase-like flavin-dependent oxidoreductase (luciferase family)